MNTTEPTPAQKLKKKLHAHVEQMEKLLDDYCEKHTKHVAILYIKKLHFEQLTQTIDEIEDL